MGAFASGNEAGDADSLVAPLCMSYLASEAERGGLYDHLPLLSVAPGELSLRPETTALFNLAGLSHLAEKGALLHMEEPTAAGSGLLASLASLSGLRVTLLDHNSLAPKVQTQCIIFVRQVWIKLCMCCAMYERSFISFGRRGVFVVLGGQWAAFGGLADSVVQIVDHHEDAGLYPDVRSEDRSVAFEVWSSLNLTLIFNRCSERLCMLTN